MLEFAEIGEMFKGATVGMMIGLLGISLAPGRIFTDSQGREVDAEVLMVQVKEGTVTLSVNGSASKFPITDLSVDDQAYLKEWLARPFQPKVKVEVATVKGQAPGEFSKREVNKEYQHYIIEFTNRTVQELTHVSLKAGLYIRNRDGSIERKQVTYPLRMPLKGTASRTFTPASVAADKAAGQSFGGYWVEIYQGAKKVGEAKSLAPNVDPAKIVPP